MSRRFITGLLSTAILITAISAAAPSRASDRPALERILGTAAGLFVIGQILGGVADATENGGPDIDVPATTWRDAVNPHRRAGPYWAPESAAWRGARG